MSNLFPVKKRGIFGLVAIVVTFGGWWWAASIRFVENRPTTIHSAPDIVLNKGHLTKTAGSISPAKPSENKSLPAAVAKSLPGSLSPRLLSPLPIRNLASVSAITDRWPTATTLVTSEDANQANPSLSHRVRIVRTGLKYPLIRLEETLRKNDPSGSEILVQQVAMVADHVLIKPVKGFDESALLTALTAGGNTVRSIKPTAKIYLVTVPTPLALNGLPEAIDTLKALQGVITIAEPDFVVHGSLTPNDPSFSQLWGLNNTGQTGGWADADIDAAEAWTLSTGSRNIRVGIIDSGIDYTHPDLAANVWTNPEEIPGNGVDDDGDGYVDDVHGWDFVNHDADPMDDESHGTHCAGTIGALGNNNTGVAGVNWNVSLVAIKFLDSSNSGSTSDAIEAISYANRIGLDLTSNSWGGPGYSQALYDVIAEANTAGHLFITAAGNDAANADASPNYPSCFNLPNIISVAATDASDQLANFSNYGATSVDLAAPGVSILSTAPGAAYQTMSGTSMSTPHVAGAAALLLAYHASLSPAQSKNALLNSADPLPVLAGKTVSGGRLNLYAALLSLENIIITPESGWTATGSVGGPFPESTTTFTLKNLTDSPHGWTATSDVSWAQLSATSGILPTGASVTLNASLNTSAAQGLTAGIHSGHVHITDTTSGLNYIRTFTINARSAIYSFDLTTDPGWARTGQWAFGQPSGQGGISAGAPDPTSGYTGPNVFGINLSGDYSTTSGGPYTLTAGPFNLTGSTATQLRFRRWLNIDNYPYVDDTVQVSTNGTTWTLLWRNGTTLISESSWKLQEIDLSTYADNKSIVYLRWTHQCNQIPLRLSSKQNSLSLSGWNIDDIAILGIPPDADGDGLPYTWETARSLDPSSSAGINGTLGDPDHDGIPNLLEYAFGLDPLQPDSQPTTSCQIALNSQTGQNNLVFTYRQLLLPGALVYTVLTSSSLSAWAAPAQAPDVLATVNNPDGITQTVTVRINPALNGAPLFVRLQVGVR